MMLTSIYAYVFANMSRLFAGDIASGVELMGMPMPTLIHLLLLKLLRVGIITAYSGNSFQTVFCVKKVNILFIFLQYVFPSRKFVPLKMWAVKIQKKKKKQKQKTNNNKKKKQQQKKTNKKKKKKKKKRNQF